MANVIKTKHKDWSCPERVSPGWRRLDWNESLKKGIYWRRIDEQYSQCTLPEGDWKDEYAEEAQSNSSVYTDWTAGFLVEYNGNYGVWEVFIRQEGYVPAPRRLPLNPIYATTLPIP